jgi:hypothetical protein
MTVCSFLVQDHDLSKTDLMGRITIDLSEVAMTKGRRIAQWFPVAFVEDEQTNPWQVFIPSVCSISKQTR